MNLATLTITKQVVFSGLISGLLYGLLALGIILVYRSSRVINFSVGAVGALSASLLLLLVLKFHWNFWPAAIIAVLAGGGFAAIVETTVITRLFRAPRVILLVATIGVSEIAQAAQFALPRSDSEGIAKFPTAFHGLWAVGNVRVKAADISALVAVPCLMFALHWFLSRTLTGKAVRAAAANPDRARLSAINPKLLSTLVWTLAGLLSAISFILVAGVDENTSGLSSLGPNTLSRVLAAALIARMASFPRALIGGIAIGVVESVAGYNATSKQTGVRDALLFVAVLVATIALARRADRDEDASFSFAPRARPIPDRLRGIWWIERLPRIVGGLALIVAIIVPQIFNTPSRQILYARMFILALVALSLVLLTGWSGQVSLAQAAFAGIGAFSYAALTNGNRLGIGYGTHRFVIDFPRLPAGIAFAAIMVVCAAIAALVGAGALRIRGLLLAAVTFTFALAVQQYGLRRPFFAGPIPGAGVSVNRPMFASVNFNSQRAYYYLTLAILALTMMFVARLRRHGFGRGAIAVRDNADSAAAYTVSPTMTKLRVFAISGSIAGSGGALLGMLFGNLTGDQIAAVDASIQSVAIAVIGGVGSVAGPILGSLWVIGLPAFWPKSTIVPLLSGGFGLIVLLMYLPGGLVQLGYAARDTLFRWAERRLSETETETATKPRAVPRSPQVRKAPASAAAGNVLTTTSVSVNFGGRIAVNDVSISLAANEVVGLIGTNGAGKSTLMNAIGGYVACQGRIELLGTDISQRKAERRARIGLGRTFQNATLFGDLTVRETLQIALEARHRSSFVSTALFLPRSFRVNKAQRNDADEIIAFLGLGRYADRFCGELSTGTRRIVELGALLALDAQVLCLDEPTAGVAQRETEAFGPLLLRIRDELQASLIVIEHDMPLIMSISDRVYCMEAGQVIAHGSPNEVRNNPAVIASYLGTDQRAIARSGATS